MTVPTVNEQTVLCDDGMHHSCGGYIAPLVYANSKPCRCQCHLGEPARSPRVITLVGDTIESYNLRVYSARVEVV